MPAYETKYTFTLAIEGANAVAQARDYKQQLDQALSGVGSKISAPLPGEAFKKARLPKPEEVLPQGWLQRFTAGVNEATKEMWGLRRVGYGIESFGRSMERNALMAAAAIAVTVKQYTDFDEAVSRAAISMSLASNLQAQFRDSILETSVAMAKFSPEELALGLRYWVEGTGEAIKSSEQLQRAMGDMVSIQKLAALGDANLAGTTDQVGGIMHEFGLEVKDVAMITEVLNYTAATTFTHVEDMGNAFKMVGPIAHSMGISFTETASALALLSNYNVKGTMAGRAFRQMLLQLDKPSDQYNKSMNAMLGINADMGESWKQIVFPGGKFMGLANYFDLLAESVENLTQQEKNERLAAIATANELPTLVALVNQQVEARKMGVNMLSVYQKVMNGVTDEEVYNYKRLYEAQTGLPFSLEGAHAMMTNRWKEYEQSDSFRAQQMLRRWQTVFIKMGEVFTKEFLSYAEDATKAMQKFMDFVKENKDWAGPIVEATVAMLALGKAIEVVGFALKTFANLYIAAAGLIKAGLPGEGGMMVGGAGGMAAQAMLALMSGNPAIVAAFIAKYGAQFLPKGGPATAPLPKWEEQLGGRAVALQRASPDVQKLFFTLFEYDQATEKFIAKSEQAMQLVQQAVGTRKEEVEAGVELFQVVQQITAQQEKLTASINGSATSEQSFAEEIEKAAAAMKAMPMMQRTLQYISAIRPSAEANLELQQLDQDILERETDFADRRTEMLRDHGRQDAMAYRDYKQAQLDAMEDFRFRESRTLEDYALEDGRRQEDFNRNEARAAQQHQESMQRMAQEHHNRLIDLVETRDVRGIVKEMRDYKTRRKEAEGDYRTQAGQRAEDYARQTKEENSRRALDAKRRQEDFDRQTDEAKRNFEKQKSDRDAALGLELDDLAKARDKDILDLRTKSNEKVQIMIGARTDQKAILDGTIEDLQTFVTQRNKALGQINYASPFYTGAYGEAPGAAGPAPVGQEFAGWKPPTPVGQEFAGWRPAGAAPGVAPETAALPPLDWDRFLHVVRSMAFLEPPDPTVWSQVWALTMDRVSVFGQMLDGLIQKWQPPGLGEARQSGGYAPGGQYTLGERGPEFVLSAPTTRLLETQWGRLSQPLFINKASRGEGASAFTYAPTFQGMGAEDKAWYAMVARREAEKIINEKTGGYRR